MGEHQHADSPATDKMMGTPADAVSSPSPRIFFRASTEPSPERAWALMGAAHLATFEKYDMARELLSEAMTLHEKFDDLRGISQTLEYLSVLAFDAGDSSEAKAMAERSLDKCRKVGDPWELAHALNNLALYVHLLGDEGSQARDRLEEALVLARATGDERLICTILDSLATVARDQGELATARSYLQEHGGIVSRHVSDRWQVCSLLDGFQ